VDATSPLVGRREELDVALRLMDGGGALMLCGRGGAGRTRLAGEIAALARRRGWPVTWATATRATRTVPLGVLAGVLPGLGLGRRAGGALDHLELLHRAASALAAPAAGPHVVVVDDAHLVDDLTAGLLLHLAANPGVFVVATVRSGEPVPDPLVTVWKDGFGERLAVRFLGREDADEMVRRLVDGPVDAYTLGRLRERTGGSPLYLRELVRDGLESGRLRRAHGYWTWTGDVRAGSRLEDIVEAGLAGLTRPERDLLDALALAEPVDVDVLGEVADCSRLGDLEGRGLVRLVSADGTAQALVADPVCADVLRTRLPASTRRLLVVRLADAFDRRGTVADPVRLADWRLEAGRPLALRELVAAAGRANARGERPTAERLARAALRRRNDVAAALELAAALNAQRRHEEAALALRPWSRSPEKLTADQQVALATELHDSLFWGTGDAAAARSMLDRVRARAGDPVVVENVDALRLTMLFLSGRTPAAADGGQRLDGRGDHRARLRAVPALGALALSGRAAEALERVEAMSAVAADVADRMPEAVSWVLAVRVLCLHLLGRLDEAEGLLRLFHAVEAPRRGEDLAVAAVGLGAVALARGAPDTALGWLGEALVTTEHTEARIVRPWALALAAQAAVLRRDLAAAEGYLAEYDAGCRPVVALHHAPAATARAWVRWRQGDGAAACGELLAAAEAAGRLGQRTARAELLHDALRLGWRAGAVRALSGLAEVVDGPLAPAYLAHARALVADDGAGLEAASVTFERLGLGLLAAEAAVEAAAALGRAGLAARATAAARRSAELAGRCEGAHTPALAAAAEPVPLTRREREIGTLAAQGLTNAEIAARLHVSVRTVEGHLYNTYAKLGVGDRVTLAALLA